ncbi:MAG: aminopeptidase P N-terminal domain-containing protein [Gammaproteobacteria bacterium]|nr:aminopeptidase P N-terminal domain-containing protein [Gammaproteobacteria bacterium]MDH4314975.1 aminopeptidase P N-terminal domain-containing protein [Gammaproteobacteria bacterium]MDH5214383.1 aminopeptidase P N-terminal domain-containing protein [Gammaproteobacteria bacterium]MDH5501908.1 aminopeptidase P N-terminal domain-containing protein [Gammaproteobacteria bacterium]
MNSKEFARRRQTLMRMVGENGIAILPSAPQAIRSRDVEYKYRQDSDFYYLTGFAEPESVAVLAPGRENGEFILFCRERDNDKERWDGSRAGTDGAVSDYAADDAFPISDIDDILPGIMESRSSVYYTMGAYADFDAQVAEWVNSLRSKGSSGIHTPQEFVALDHVLHDMRLYKSRAEISAMRKSAKIAVAAHTRAISMISAGLFEYQVEAEYLHEFRRHNATMSYSPIVGSGENACTLHYIRNNSRLEDGDLVLIDAGCELDYYASDITRTLPVSGRFTPEQLAVYEIVLQAQLAAIDKTRVGNHWNDPHDAAVAVITRGLKKLGLLQGSLPKLIRDGAYREFFMHRTGHWIGMDVHDVGDYKVGDEWRQLESGMVTTVEPGIYITASRKVPARWRNIGIRIEDDVAVSSNGPDVLTGGLVKEPDAIEKLMAA